MGDMEKRLVADLITERHVEAAQLGATFGQVTDANIGDVIASTQV